MKQYMGLVDNAATDGGKTSSDDLQVSTDNTGLSQNILNNHFICLRTIPGVLGPSPHSGGGVVSEV